MITDMRAIGLAVLMAAIPAVAEAKPAKAFPTPESGGTGHDRRPQRQ